MSLIEETYVPIDVVASRLSIRPNTLRKWIREGSIQKHTYIKVGNTYRFNADAVIDALKNGHSGFNDLPVSNDEVTDFTPDEASDFAYDATFNEDELDEDI